MSGDRHWNPEDTQTLDALERKTEREKWAEIRHQIQSMGGAVGTLREKVASLQTHVFYLKWIVGIALGLAVTAIKLHG